MRPVVNSLIFGRLVTKELIAGDVTEKFTLPYSIKYSRDLKYRKVFQTIQNRKPKQ